MKNKFNTITYLLILFVWVSACTVGEDIPTAALPFPSETPGSVETTPPEPTTVPATATLLPSQTPTAALENLPEGITGIVFYSQTIEETKKLFSVDISCVNSACVSREEDSDLFENINRIMTENSYVEIYPSPNGTQIVFILYGQLPFEIHVYDLITGETKKLNIDIGTHSVEHLSWSPDSKSIAFEKSFYPRGKVWIVDVENNLGREVYNSEYGWNFSPVWSPDSSKIAYLAQYENCCTENKLVVMDKDSYETNPPVISDYILTIGKSRDYQPHIWSPDGQSIAYASYGKNESSEYSYEIYTVDIASRVVKRVTTNSGSDQDPLWSPDSSQILFESDRNGNNDLYIADRDGGNLRQLTTDQDYDYNPIWSSDSSQIFFLTYRKEYSDLYVMDRDGSNLIQLTMDHDHVWGQTLAPDGSYLAFNSGLSGEEEIFIISPDGSWERQLTNNGEDKEILWIVQD